jgi:elongation factor P
VVATSEFKPGMTIEVEGQAVQIVQCDHHQGVGRGGAIMRTRLRNLKTGVIYDKTFRTTEKVPKARLDRAQMQYLYSTGDAHVFMDNETFEQLELTPEQVGDDAKWLKDGESVLVTTYDGALIGVEVPNSVERKVIQTDPGLKGDTASGGNKPAVVEGDVTVMVPLFIQTGDKLKIDTRTGNYVERASS